MNTRNSKKNTGKGTKAPYVRTDGDVTDALKHNYKVAFDALVEGINGGYTDRFKTYLEAASKLHSYSWGNCMLFFMQNPNVSHVASYGTWQKLGRQVRKGEKAMYLNVPYVCKGKDGGQGEDGMNNEGGGGYTFFALKPGAFDISQTDPIEGKDKTGVLSQWWTDLGDNDGGFLPYVVKAIGTLGYDYAESDMAGHGQANGYAMAGKVIRVKDSLPRVNKTKTAVHELAHHLHGHIDEKTSDKVLKELEAEATAYVVLHHYGLDTAGFSFDYLKNWKATPDSLRAAFGKIVKVAHKIITAIDAEAGVAEQEKE